MIKEHNVMLVMMSSIFGVDQNVMKMIGAVSFIRLLLVLAGVEMNPGPVKQQFIFRYQYLLIDVGTEVVQKLFDSVIGTSLSSYLAANVKAEQKLKFLMTSGKITKSQQAFLPPIDKNPVSSNFDITLLSCLLRNICGLRHFNDTVWTSPAPTDHSLEADITRLRECRNQVAHMLTVYMSDADLTIKWIELTQILKRLNGCHRNGVTDLSSKVNEAEHMDIDEKLRNHYDTTVDQWREMERLYDHGIEDLKVKMDDIEQGLCSLKLSTDNLQKDQTGLQQELSTLKKDQTEIKDTHSEIKDAQSVLKHDLEQLKQEQTQLKEDVQKDKLATYQKEQEFENEKDLKRRLMTIYQEDCSTVPVLPLCDKDEDDVDLLSFYKPASLFHVPYHKTEDNGKLYQPSSYDEDLVSDEDRFVKHLRRTLDGMEAGASKSCTSGKILYKDIFESNKSRLRNIFITGDAGVGKSSFCKCMALLWYWSQDTRNIKQREDFLSHQEENLSFMETFEFVFLISLQDTDRTDVITMIVEQVFTEAEFDGKMSELYKFVENILRNRACLVILDGLDEWNPKTSRKKDIILPDKVTAEKCKYLVTCRPYKIETVRLSRKDIERQVHMTGIEGESVEIYVKEIVNRCNRANDERRNPNDFFREIKHCGLYKQLCIPIIGSHLVAIWFDFELTDMSRALIYSHIIEMLFERAEMRSIRLPPAEACSIQIPDNLAGLCYIKHNFGFLAKLCLLSFRSLFELDKCVSVLVYTRIQLLSDPYFFSIDEMDFLCQLGILSRNKVIGRLGKQEQKLSYLHKSYLEYFAALFVSSFDDGACNAFDNVVKEWNSINDVLQYQNFFIFLSGFSHEKGKLLFKKMYSRISTDLNCCRRNTILCLEHQERYACEAKIMSLQNFVLSCFQQPYGLRNPMNESFELADFIFGKDYSEDETQTDSFENMTDTLQLQCDDSINHDIELDYLFNAGVERSLKQLLLLNRTRVFSLYSALGKYSKEFDQITHLHHLHVRASQQHAYDDRFSECMLRNQSTLQMICVNGSRTVISELPLRNIHNLTSLTLSYLKMSHDNLHDLIKYLTENVLMENIHMCDLSCVNHQYRYYNCTTTLDLSNHSKLLSLYMWYVKIRCTNINKTSLRQIKLHPFCQGTTSLYNTPVYE